MGRQVLPILIFAAASCGRSEPVFREVAAISGPIRLGAIWEAPGDTLVSLPAGSIPGTGPVAVRRTPGGVVRSIWVNYPQSADFDRMARGYRGRFGPPVRHVRPADPESREVLAWEDADTRFELVRDPRRSVSTVYGVLSDKPGAGSR
jgi:hypothetical protein